MSVGDGFEYLIERWVEESLSSSQIPLSSPPFAIETKQDLERFRQVIENIALRRSGSETAVINALRDRVEKLYEVEGKLPAEVIQKVFSFLPARDLTASFQGKTTLEAKELEMMQRWEALDLRDKENIERLNAGQSVKDVGLSFDELLDLLSKYPRLSNLRLEWVDFSEDKLVRLFSSLDESCLKELVLEECKGIFDESSAKAVARCCGRLEKLSITAMGGGHLLLRELKKMSLPCLHEFLLSPLNLSEAQQDFSFFLLRAFNLRELDLRGCIPSKSILGSLIEDVKLPELCTLNLSWIFLTKEDARGISKFLQYSPRLKELFLNRTVLDSDAWEALLNQPIPSLKVLGLRGAQPNGYALAYFLSNCPQLEVCDLQGSSLSSEDIMQISLGLLKSRHSLRELRLSGGEEPWTEEAVQNLARLMEESVNLKCLDLEAKLGPAYGGFLTRLPRGLEQLFLPEELGTDPHIISIAQARSPGVEVR